MMSRMSVIAVASLAVVACDVVSGHEEGPLLIWLAIMLLAAKIGGEVATRLGQPAVFGELCMGVILGNLALVGFGGLEPIKSDQFVDMLSHLGVLLLLFEVGLESTVKDMLSVGWSALLVALCGVVTPFALGWGCAAWLIPQHGPYVHAFIGATLTATSVGITARVLKELGASTTGTARVILGAAVLDDVLGLVILAAVTGIVAGADRGGGLDVVGIAVILGKAGAFLVASLIVGALVSRRLFGLASRLRARAVLLPVALAMCFFFAWAAQLMGLAPIVGAFAAGLVLEETHYRDLVTNGDHPLETLIHPIAAFLTPLFFVLVGMRTDLSALGNTTALILACALTGAAIVGKLVAGAGVLGRGIDRLTVGIGMIPRGEVGLIFANVGLNLRVHGEAVIDGAVFSAMIIVVIATTIVTPPALKWSLARRPRPL
jgi:Kef-type K+ transport system membrane component KefB